MGRVLRVESEIEPMVVSERRLQVRKLLWICVKAGWFGGDGAEEVVLNERSSRVWAMSKAESAAWTGKGKEEAGEAGWLLHRAGEGLVDVVVGKRDGVEVLFG